MPDLNTFGLLCRWLELDPGDLLGVAPRPGVVNSNDIVSAHLKANRESILRQQQHWLAQLC